MDTASKQASEVMIAVVMLLLDIILEWEIRVLSFVTAPLAESNSNIRGHCRVFKL
jgi:hypothetical protein